MQSIDTSNFGSFFDVLATTERSQAASMVLKTGQSTGGPTNEHRNCDQWLYILDGQGRATIDGTHHDIKEGDLICIEAGETHEITAESDQPLKSFSIYAPPEY